MRIAVLAICFFLPSLAAAQPLLVDGLFGDWNARPALTVDATGDDGGSGVDFATLKITHDERFLYIRFNTTAEVVLQEDNTLRLYIDTDFDASTGQQLQGLGAELIWNFAGRSGTLRVGGSTRSIDHADIGLYPAPTYSSTDFEIALRRDVIFDGRPLYSADSLRVALAVIEANGDRIPDTGGAAYGLDGEGLPAPPETMIGEPRAEGVRLLTWNTLQDGLIDAQRQPAFARVLRAVQPDIMCFQESFDGSAGQVLLFVRSVIDPPTGRAWRTLKLDQGNVLITHLDVEESWVLQNNYRETASLLSTPSGRKMLLINCHFRCCSADLERQQEADGVIRFIRDAKTPGGEITLDEGTPIVLTGDLNLVGDRLQIETLLTGDIADNTRYGPDEKPDWDGGDMALCVSRHPRSRIAHTWRNPRSSYAPSILDYIIYTGSSMSVMHDMVINTADMSAAQLQQYALESDDCETASDHLPRFADLLWEAQVTVGPVAAANGLTINALWPQPACDRLQLRLGGAHRPVAITVTDLLGRSVLKMPAVSAMQTAVDIGALRSGTYFLRVSDGRRSTATLFVVE
ncbi:MAG: endonuclease/exonuclease/phosphatase family protein [Bacteroidota bacterium]|nr:endonuclease/exonuclease/phosphatase family protein [Bacteroidota bacterium]